MGSKDTIALALVGLGKSFEAIMAELQSMGADPVLTRLAVSQQRESLATAKTILDQTNGNSN